MRLDLMRDSSKIFPTIENPKGIKSLRIWHCKYRNFNGLEFFTNLEELVIASFPEGSFAKISNFTKLKYLAILHMPKVSNLNDLTTLSNLKCLSLITLPSWVLSRKRTIVDSLKPICELKNLRHLELIGILPGNDNGINELYCLKYLKSARFEGFLKKDIEKYFEITGIEKNVFPNSSFA